MERPPRKPKKTNGAAPRKENVPSKKQPPDYKAISGRATDPASQSTRALELLKIADQTTYNLRGHGIAQCAARIFKLKERGHPITKTTVNAADSDGYTHSGVALYSLREVAA